MSEVSYLLAKELGLDEEQADLLKKAAPMHDIGKIATPDSVLLKPGRLDDDEMQIMKMHSAIGYKILGGSNRPILQSAAIISHQHHEKYDGTGYPDGVAGDDIHIFARIVAVADVFDALTHKRCYKEAWPREDVIKFMKEGAGSHMDPNIVEKLLANIDACYQINETYKD
jgi:response regulator RpfG family c-di-GMP phosphodiesterase